MIDALDLSRGTIDDAFTDTTLLGAALGDPTTWQMWRTIFKAGYGLALGRSEARAFASVAGSRKPPTQRVRELWAIVGRRGGKSRMAALIACYAACFQKYALAPGEKGMVVVIAMSLDQAKVVFNYALAFLQSSPVLRQLIDSTTASEIRLTNGIVIATYANSFEAAAAAHSVVPYSMKSAFWHDDTTANPDTEVYSAVIPMLLTTKGMLIGISSAYRRAGLLYQKHRDYFGKDDDDTLVVKGATTDFNQSVDEGAIAALRAADPAGAVSGMGLRIPDRSRGLPRRSGDRSCYQFRPSTRTAAANRDHLQGFHGSERRRDGW